MTIKKFANSLSRGLVISLFALYLFSAASTVHAQSTMDMTVSPPTQELSISPGEEKSIQVKFYNRTDAPITGTFQKSDFLILDKDGVPTLMDQTISNNRFTATSWIKLSQDKATIPPKTQVVLNATIKAPKDAYPCGRYTSIFFEPNSPTLGGKKFNFESKTAVAFRLASLIFLNVPGECKENAYVNKVTIPTFLEYGPVPVSFEILNRSDYHIAPKALVTVTNLFKQQVDSKPLPENRIFPDAIRTYTVNVGEKWMFGQYNVELTGGYGTKGKTLSSFASIIVFPWRVTLVVILTIATLLILVKAITDKLRKKTTQLETELAKEKSEIEKLKAEVKNRKED